MELFLCVKTSGKENSETKKDEERKGDVKEEVSGRHKASSQLLVTVGCVFRDNALNPSQKLLGLASFQGLQYLIAVSI